LFDGRLNGHGAIYEDIRLTWQPHGGLHPRLHATLASKRRVLLGLARRRPDELDGDTRATVKPVIAEPQAPVTPQTAGPLQDRGQNRGSAAGVLDGPRRSGPLHAHVRPCYAPEERKNRKDKSRPQRRQYRCSQPKLRTH